MEADALGARAVEDVPCDLEEERVVPYVGNGEGEDH